MKFKSITVAILLLATGPAVAGPIGYAICQTGKRAQSLCPAVLTSSRLQWDCSRLLFCSRVYVRRCTTCSSPCNYRLQYSPWGMYGGLRRSRAWTHSLSEFHRGCGERTNMSEACGWDVFFVAAPYCILVHWYFVSHSAIQKLYQYVRSLFQQLCQVPVSCTLLSHCFIAINAPAVWNAACIYTAEPV